MDKIDPSVVFKSLMRKLDDPNPDERLSAIATLGVMFKSSSHSDYDTLSMIDDAVQKLRQIIKKDPSDNVRIAAIGAFGEMNYRDSVPILINSLKDPTPNICAAAAKALGLIGDPTSVHFLLDAALSAYDQNPSLPNALARFKDPKIAKNIVDALLKGVESPETAVAKNAINALIVINDPRALPALIKASKKPNQEIRELSIYSLSNFRNEQLLPVLLPALSDSSSAVKIAAIYVIAGVEGNMFSFSNLHYDPIPNLPKDVISSIISLSKDPDPEVRACSAAALGKIGDTSAESPLIAALNDPERNVRLNATYALGNLGSSKATKNLIKIMNDPSEDVRVAGIFVLAQLKEKTAIPDLIGALKDSNSNVRFAAISTLGIFLDVSSIPPLLESLKDKESYLREAAIDALRKFTEQKIPIDKKSYAAIRKFTESFHFEKLKSDPETRQAHADISNVLSDLASQSKPEMRQGNLKSKL